MDTKEVNCLAKQLNLFVSNFFKENDNWRINKPKKNDLLDYLKKNKSSIISIINKLTYINKDNYTNAEIYKNDVEKQRELKKKLKKILCIEEEIEENLNNLFFKSKQNLLFKYVLNNKIIRKFGSNVKYEFMLEKYIYLRKNKVYLNNIYKEIVKEFLDFEFAILNEDLALTKFTQMFIQDDLFENIKNGYLNEEQTLEIIELLLDLKNKLLNKVIVYFLHIHLMIKHNIISYDVLEFLLMFIKYNAEKGLCDTTNIIYTENTSLWCHYFIINYHLYKDLEEYKYIFTPNIISKIYSKYTYMKYL